MNTPRQTQYRGQNAPQSEQDRRAAAQRRQLDDNIRYKRGKQNAQGFYETYAGQHDAAVSSGAVGGYRWQKVVNTSPAAKQAAMDKLNAQRSAALGRTQMQKGGAGGLVRAGTYRSATAQDFRGDEGDDMRFPPAKGSGLTRAEQSQRTGYTGDEGNDMRFPSDRKAAGRVTADGYYDASKPGAGALTKKEWDALHTRGSRGGSAFKAGSKSDAVSVPVSAAKAHAPTPVSRGPRTYMGTEDKSHYGARSTNDLQRRRNTGG